MVEGWLRHLASDRFEVFGAGTQPVGLSSGAVEAMRESGWISRCIGQSI